MTALLGFIYAIVAVVRFFTVHMAPQGWTTTTVLLLIVGGLKEDDLQRMPMIGRVGIKFLRKIGVFKTEEKQEA